MTEHRPDHVSDPSQDDHEGSDWSDEGGAMPQGPATDETADDMDAEEGDESGSSSAS